MLIRSNPCYPPMLQRDKRGLLIVTRRFIIATGMFARCWQ